METATNFDIRISKEVAKELISPLSFNPQSTLARELGFSIMCKEMGEDEDWIGVESPEEIEDDDYKTFEIWLQNSQTKVIVGDVYNNPDFGYYDPKAFKDGLKYTASYYFVEEGVENSEIGVNIDNKWGHTTYSNMNSLLHDITKLQADGVDITLLEGEEQVD